MKKTKKQSEEYTNIRISQNLVRQLKIIKAYLNFNTYDELIRFLVSRYNGVIKDEKTMQSL